MAMLEGMSGPGTPAHGKVLEAIFNTLHDGVSVVDDQLKIVYANAAARRFMGLQPAAALPARWTDIQGCYDADRVTRVRPEELVLGRMANGARERMDECFIVNDNYPPGVCLESTSITMAMAMQGDAALGARLVIWRDVTNARQAQQAQRDLTASLEESLRERDLAIGELEAFCYSVAHDLRAPLRAIDGFVSLLFEEHDAQAGGETLDYLHRVRANARRMGALIDDLLSFSHLGRKPLMTQTVSVADLVQECLDTLRAGEGGESVAGVTVALGELPACQGDPGLLREVWMNLLSNAFKFSGKHVAPRVEVGSRAADGITAYFVRDNGVGFDMRYADKLFGVFQRLHSTQEFPGTGVGLAIVQRIVHRHGGRIWAEAEPGQGATFYFTVG